MSEAELAAAVRGGAGLFVLPDRAILAVRGEDRVRWLDGMITADVRRLGGDGPRAAYALLLTPKGRIVADLHVFAREDDLLLETARSALPRVREELERRIVADDVELLDESAAWERLGLEGPAAAEILAAVADRPLALATDDGSSASLAGVPCLVLAFGWSGEAAFQIAAPRERGAAVRDALETAGQAHGLVRADAAALEVLRVEAGVPRTGAELDESVLPQEAGLDRIVAHQKGCYTGQEVVARLRTQGQVSHRLVGLRLEGEPPPPGAPLLAGDRKVGEVSSAVRSPRFGAIALGFVRRPHDTAGTELRCADRPARVTPLPFS